MGSADKILGIFFADKSIFHYLCNQIITYERRKQKFSFAGWATREFYTESYHNKMLVTYEYTRRVLSDVYVAVTNNIYYVEQHLDDSEYPKGVMERIVHNGTRVRSCGISFIEDYYYPERGHRFCPFAWRNSANPDIIYSENMGDADLDYLVADWFLDVIKADTAVWSDRPPVAEFHHQPRWYVHHPS